MFEKPSPQVNEQERDGNAGKRRKAAIVGAAMAAVGGIAQAEAGRLDNSVIEDARRLKDATGEYILGDTTGGDSEMRRAYETGFMVAPDSESKTAESGESHTELDRLDELRAQSASSLNAILRIFREYDDQAWDKKADQLRDHIDEFSESFPQFVESFNTALDKYPELTPHIQATGERNAGSENAEKIRESFEDIRDYRGLTEKWADELSGFAGLNADLIKEAVAERGTFSNEGVVEQSREQDQLETLDSGAVAVITARDRWKEMFGILHQINDGEARGHHYDNYEVAANELQTELATMQEALGLAPKVNTELIRLLEGIKAINFSELELVGDYGESYSNEKAESIPGTFRQVEERIAKMRALRKESM